MNCETFWGERPAPSRDYAWSFYAWLTYYVITEEFDRTLPGRMSERDADSWLVRLDYRTQSSVFAHRMRQEILGDSSTEGRQAAERLRMREADEELERRAVALVAGHDPAGLTVDDIDWGEM